MQEIHLDDWQKDIIKAKGNILLCTGRQVGKTTTFAIKAAKRMLEVPETRIICVSLTEDQAQLMIVMVLSYLETHHKREIAKGKSKPTKNIVTTRNKSRIIARPVGNTGDAVRGFTGDVLIVDEASRMPELMWTAAKPTLLTTGGELWFCSTPAGKQGYFYECFINKHKRFQVWHKSSEAVIRERPITESWSEEKRAEAIRILEEEKKDMSELQYGQEYLGLFLEELQQFFPDQLIEQCCTLSRPDHIQPYQTYIMGCDIARLGGDESTFEILQKPEHPDSPLIHVESIAKKGLLTTKNEDIIKELIRKWHLKKVGIDAGSGTLGVSIMDHLMEDRGIRHKVVAMNNRKVVLDREGKETQRIMKEEMYDNLRALMERKQIKLLNDSDVKLSLRSVQWELLTRSNEKTKMRVFGNYTHIAEGLIRAAYLGKQKNLNLWISYI